MQCKKNLLLKLPTRMKSTVKQQCSRTRVMSHTDIKSTIWESLKPKMSQSNYSKISCRCACSPVKSMVVLKSVLLWGTYSTCPYSQFSRQFIVHILYHILRSIRMPEQPSTHLRGKKMPGRSCIQSTVTSKTLSTKITKQFVFLKN